MSGVVCKLLGGVLAISLFVSSSLLAFAAPFPSFYQFNTYYNSELIDTFSSSTDVSSASASINLNYSSGSTIGFIAYGNEDGGKQGYHTVSFSFYTDSSVSDLESSLDTLYFRLAAYNDTILEYANLTDFSISYDYLRGAGTANSIHTFNITYFLPDLSTLDSPFQFRFYFVFDDSFLINSVTYSSSFLSDPSQEGVIFPSFPDYSDITHNFDGIYSNGEFTLWPDWSSLIYDIELMWFSNLGPFFNNLFSNLGDRVTGFLFSVGNIVSSNFNVLFDRMDKQDDDYEAVTDPATSQEIQETQQMIDTVEDFESQLHGNITTEFDKIDFTTPTNLAAPVAYVGDKITLSMNSLGNFQPLIFVPLVLGIMLVMLGRGVSALGHLGSSAARAATRIRSKGGGS